MKWLEENRPKLASAITSLAWVEDDIEGIERQAFQELVNVETLYGTEADPVLVNKSWLADGVDELEVSVMVQLRLLATHDEVPAREIVRMPFLDTLESGDYDTLMALADLARPLNWRALLRAVVQKPWVGDGLSESEAAVLRHLGWITNGNEDTALRILDMPFLQTRQPGDGPAASTVSALWALGAKSQETLRAVVEKTWVEDGLDESEAQALKFLDWIARDGEDIALRLVAAPFLQTVESADGATLETLWGLGATSQDTLRAVVEKSWVEDGLDEAETAFVHSLRRLAERDEERALTIGDKLGAADADAVDVLVGLADRHQELFRAVLERPWVGDGLDESESELLNYLNWTALGGDDVALWLATFVQTVEADGLDGVWALWLLGAHSQETLRAVMAKPWAEDGLDGAETVFVRNLGWLARDGEETALELLDVFTAKSWFEDGLTESEAVALGNLVRVAGSDVPAARQILAMPFLQTVEPADAAATQTLGHMAAYRPENFRRVMAHPTLSGGISDEWAKVVMVLGAVSDSDPDRIDVLLDPEQVRVEERVVDLPLAGVVTLAIIRTEEGAPRSMDLLEHAVRSSEAFMGVPLPTSRVTLHFDDAYGDRGAGLNFGTHMGMLSRFDVDDDSTNAGHTGAITAHEVAHYYWRGGSPWVVEGGANMVASISEHARTGQPVDAGGLSCTHAGNIAELESQGRRGVVGCNYAFGHRLLLDLYRTLGEDGFREGFRDLYLMSRVERLDISHYKAAFTAVAPDRAADIDRIAARWYEGEVAPDVLDPDPSRVDPVLPGVSGRVQDAYIVAVDGNRRTNFSTRYTHHLWLRLLFSVRSQAEPRELRFTIEGYYEDGFAFWLRDVTVTVPAHRTSGDFQVWRSASSTYQWAPGRYIIYVYHDGQKVAEVQFQFLRIT